MTPGPRIYNLFPLLCGSVRQWEDHLPRIAAMGFDWVYVNPCQTKAEMSAFVQSRDVRLQGVMAERNSALP